ncbi:MAG TPA: hypothetical protein VGW33_03400 [Terriglobia bacterium]|nr:hypothetical protein [Terriglobia bacterium]
MAIKRTHGRDISDWKNRPGGYFLAAGFNHFTKLGMMAAYYAKGKGTPAPARMADLTHFMKNLGLLGALLMLLAIPQPWPWSLLR